mmetsp:Transcript_54015/g.126225  ORF Transcript_54015/g.126225 Transcript_54015/m.126225 type:complete len:405 (-) Transcript_54015:76-1290(-)
MYDDHPRAAYFNQFVDEEYINEKFHTHHANNEVLAKYAANPCPGDIRGLPMAVNGLALGFLILGHVWEMSAVTLLPDNSWIQLIPLGFFWLSTSVAVALLILYGIKVTLALPSFISEVLTVAESNALFLNWPVAVFVIGAMLRNWWDDDTTSWHTLLIGLVVGLGMSLYGYFSLQFLVIHLMGALSGEFMTEQYFESITASWASTAIIWQAAAGLGLLSSMMVLTGFFWVCTALTVLTYVLVMYRVFFHSRPLHDFLVPTNAGLVVPPAVLILHFASHLDAWPGEDAIWIITNVVGIALWVSVAIFVPSIPTLLEMEFNAYFLNLAVPAAVLAEASILYWKVVLEGTWLNLVGILLCFFFLILTSALLVYLTVRLAIQFYRDAAALKAAEGLEAEGKDKYEKVP